MATLLNLQYKTEVGQAQRLTHYEDVVLALPSTPFRHWSLFAVFDGHGGDTVSRFLAAQLPRELETRLPRKPLPRDVAEAYAYAELVRRALTNAFLALAHRARDERAADGVRLGLAGAKAPGASATVCLQTGSLVTVANVGGTRAVLDTGAVSFELSVDDTLGENDDEDERLAEAGATVARLRFDLSGPAARGETGCGALRVWPGGLCASRSLGDPDCAAAVVPYPHICQLWLPRRACRLIVASAPVWAAFDTYQMAAGLLRGVRASNAAGALLERAAAKRRNGAAAVSRDDRSALVVDFAPERMSGYKQQVSLDRLSRASLNGGSGSPGGTSGGGEGHPLARLSKLGSGMLDAFTGITSSSSGGGSSAQQSSGGGGNSSFGGSGGGASAPGTAAACRQRRRRGWLRALVPCASPSVRADADAAPDAAPDAAALLSPLGDDTVVRFVARVDTWRLYGRCGYAPPEQVLPALDAALAAAAARLDGGGACIGVASGFAHRSSLPTMTRRSPSSGAVADAAAPPSPPPPSVLRTSRSGGDLVALAAAAAAAPASSLSRRLPPPQAAANDAGAGGAAGRPALIPIASLALTV